MMPMCWRRSPHSSRSNPQYVQAIESYLSKTGAQSLPPRGYRGRAGSGEGLKAAAARRIAVAITSSTPARP